MLIDAGLAVFVVPSSQIKALRTRYGSAGNKDDRLDAYFLADTLRTDGHRWPPLREDHPETKAPRTTCRACKGLVEIRAQMMNQLRANRELAFPGALGLLRRLDSPITVASCDDSLTQPKLRGPHRHALDAVAPIGRLQRRHRRRDAVSAFRARHLDGVEAEPHRQITTSLVTTPKH
ncbi:IS110 family transposase [Rhodococcus qingshengii]